MPNPKYTALILGILLLNGCALEPRKDGAPDNPRKDILSTPNAIPKNEPLSKYGNPESYVVFGKRYYVKTSRQGYKERGGASWYGTKFHGQLTSSREPYDMYKMTAAHKTLPLPSYVKVENLENGKSIIVRVNDRGPFKTGRIIDLSYTAAAKLDMLEQGTSQVEVTLLNTNNHKPSPQNNETNTLFIQVGAFLSKNNAHLLQTKLKQANFRSNIQTAKSAIAKEKIYRVRLGPFKNRNHADNTVQRLVNMGLVEAKIVID